jgi:Domain of unknown function DUF11/PASTA domain
MRVRRFIGLAAGMVLVGVSAPASAWGLTLGDLATTDPGACTAGTTTAWIVQATSGTATYVVPAGGGVITSWSTSFGPAGAPVGLVATSSFSGMSAVVRGVDSETLPTPIPASNVSTFTLAHPITVQAGDLIGLNYTGGSNTRCLIPGAASDNVNAGLGSAVTGSTITTFTGLPNALVNVRVNLVQSVDLALAAAATPSAITRGDLAELTFPASGSPNASATFTDTLPAGLIPLAASAGAGSCAIAGQSVTCALPGVPTTVSIAVRGSSSGMYTDTGHLTSSVADPNPANNSASTTLAVVSPPPTPKCTVANLRGAPLSVAKAVLRLLNCRVGKVSRASSRQIPAGDVISTKPRSGRTAPVGTKVAIKVSSGKPRRHGHHH